MAVSLGMAEVCSSLPTGSEHGEEHKQEKCDEILDNNRECLSATQKMDVSGVVMVDNVMFEKKLKVRDTGICGEDIDDDTSSQDSDFGSEGSEESVKKRGVLDLKRMRKYQHYEQKYKIMIVAYVNSKSGNKQGHHVLRKLLKRLPKHHVHDLFEPLDGVVDTLPQHLEMARINSLRLRIIAAGGDGTISWVASSIEKLQGLVEYPEIAPLPLGTGNDLAKVLQWSHFIFRDALKFKSKQFIKEVFKVS